MFKPEYEKWNKRNTEHEENKKVHTCDEHDEHDYEHNEDEHDCDCGC